MKWLWLWRARRYALNYRGLIATNAWLEALYKAHHQLSPSRAVDLELDSDYPTI